MPTVLVTGGCGFAGGHLVEHLLATTGHSIVVLDSLTYAGRVNRLTDAEGFDPDRCRIIWHDLRAPLPDLPQLDDVTDVLHLAADSHVDNSITDPAAVFLNNAAATVSMLEWARRRSLDHFIQISTDEVYGPAAAGERHVEWSTILPSNPYSASKAAQEAAAISYWRTFGVPVVITNTMNLYGERQHPEKFVAKMIKAIAAGQPVTLHGRLTDGKWDPSARHWLHARNHADALCWLLDRPVAAYGESDRPDRWNVAGEERDVLEMAELIAAALDVELDWRFEDYHSSRPGHDHRYSLNDGKIREAGWSPPLALNQSLERTVSWTLKHQDWLNV